MNTDDKSLITIDFKFNGRPDDYKDFVNDLKENYQIVQARPIWLPAASEGGEMWLNVIINSPISEFIIYNATWDLIKFGTKKLFLKPLLESLDKLATTDKDTSGLKMIKLKLQFDDTCIYVGGVTKNFISITGAIFQQLSVKMNKFIHELRMPVTEIELPITYNESIDRVGISKYQIDIHHNRTNIDYYLGLWKIIYNGGVECRIYDFKLDKFKDC